MLLVDDILVPSFYPTHIDLKVKEQKLLYQRMMKEMGFKPRRRKDSHQWWESPWIDYDTPRQSYY
tara:strand:- start:28 stop:222 length:195 start_codon:yes stop_codon:yes gene_type:complete